jgi:ATP-binding cassette, subfamily B, bacterial
VTQEQDRQLRRVGRGVLWALGREQRRRVAFGIAVGLIYAAFRVAVPLVTRDVVDHGIRSGRMSTVLELAVLALLIGAISAINSGLRRYTAVSFSIRAETDLRTRMFQHLQRLSFSYHDRTQTGQLMARGNTDLLQVRQLMVFVPIAIANLFSFVAVAVILVVVDWRLGLASLVALPFLNLSANRFSRGLAPLMNELQQRLADVSQTVEENVAGVRVVKAYRAEEHEVRKLSAQADAVFDASMKANRVRATWLPLFDFLPTVSLIVVLVYGGHRAIEGQITIGSLLAFMQYLSMLIWPLRILGMIVAQYERAATSAGRVQEILSTEPLIVDSSRAAELRTGPGDVEFRHVEFAYQPGHPVLRDVSLWIPGGSSVALVGATGCGKSTVARLLPRFYEVGGGEILLDGQSIREIRLASLRNEIAIVFEDTFLFSDSIRNNIAYGRLDSTVDEVQRAARLAQAHEFIMSLPDGYETVVGEHGFTLSGGQRQRVAIARAILRDPRVLILDDATSSVDASMEEEIRAALTEVMTGRTTLIIAHRLATIALADRVIFVAGGKVMAEGTHEELLMTVPDYVEVLMQQEAAAQRVVDRAPDRAAEVGR